LIAQVFALQACTRRDDSDDDGDPLATRRSMSAMPAVEKRSFPWRESRGPPFHQSPSSYHELDAMIPSSVEVAVAIDEISCE
jgi:hypothetical protein